MSISINRLAASLQDTSRALSAKGRLEQTMLQESLIQLLGDFIMEGHFDSVEVPELSAGEVTNRLALAQHDVRATTVVLSRLQRAVLIGDDTGNAVLVRSLRDESEWESLPVQLQNFVAAGQMPCHLIFPIQRLSLPDQAKPRFYALPIGAVQSTAAAGCLTTYFTFFEKAHRDQARENPEEVKKSAAVLLEPYLRILASYVIGQSVEAVSG